VSAAELFSLDGRVAVVTGALGLLGKNHCRALASAGARVVVTDLDDGRCRGFAAELGAAYDGGRPPMPPGPAGHLGVGANITAKSSVDDLRRAVVDHYGALDVLVNNAAINDMFESPAAGAELSKFENYPLELWQRSLDVNVTGTFLCCQALGAEMARRGKGSIINIASTYGLVAPDQTIYQRPDGTQSFYKSAAYPATKGAVLALTRFVAAYWGHRGVRCNAISPGGVENAQDEYFVQNYAKKTPLGRMSRPTELAGALVFLAGDASSYMTGSNVVVDGGWTAW
jgi:NAD(P)-dependent dehydrogenase (short-subunit alcohol dehydrogenase family)